MSTKAIDHYIRTQRALGNWPHDNVWPGDEALLALVDTYDHIGADQIMAVGARWAITGDWTWG